MTETNIDPELVDDRDTDDGDDLEPVELPEYDHTPFAELPEDFDEDWDGDDNAS